MEWNIDGTYESFSQMQYEIGMDALEMLNPKPGELILDIGCGTGNLTVKIAEKVTSSHKRGDQNDRECGKVIGIDKDKTMIEGAQKRKEIRGLDNLHFMQIDAIQIDYHNEFDAVFSNIVIHWVKDLNKLFEKLYISLKKKGRITIATIYQEEKGNSRKNEQKKRKDQMGNQKEEQTQVSFSDTLKKIENKYLKTFISQGHFRGILTMKEFQTHQSKVDPDLTYKVHSKQTLHEMISQAGFKNIQMESGRRWNEFQNIEEYLTYRESNIWLFFLAYFPKKYHQQVIKKLKKLIKGNIKAKSKSGELKINYPIREKWPLLFIQAEKK